MKFETKTPEELEASRKREMREFAEAETRAQQRATDQHNEIGADSPTDTDAAQTPKFQQQHGNRKYSMFKNETASDNMPTTRTDTLP